MRGDAGRLRQVLTNLGGNAVKFTSSGEVAIRLSLEEKTDKRRVIRFEVRDTGIGIAEDDIERLFTPFTQVDGTTTRKYGGTGLGLSISKRLVELMGGSIGVESQTGRGSTFWFTVALEAHDEAANQQDATPSLIGARVLVVDDTATNREVLLEMLGSWGCQSEAAINAGDGMIRLRRAVDRGLPYHVALIDMCMPGEDGTSLGRRIREDHVFNPTKIIMVTSLGQSANEVLRDIGFEGCITKPIRQGRLREVLAACVKGTLGSTLSDRSPPASLGRMAMSARVLLVEDNATNQLVAAAILEKLGHRVDVAGNGFEAIAALASISYELVLMDCQMPEMDGFEATRRIRSGEAGPDARSTAIIAMTAEALQGDRERCLEAGMDDYLPKPIGGSMP